MIVPAATFEKQWNQGNVFDVWGATVSHVPLGESMNETFKRLRLLRIASGCVAGVEKIYLIAKLGEEWGMIEVSVDLQTKRLSAVFKLSRPTDVEKQASATTSFRALFDAFQRAIEEGKS